MKKLIYLITVLLFSACAEKGYTPEPEYITTAEDSANVQNELEIIKNRNIERSIPITSLAAQTNYPTTIKKVFQVEAYENADYSRILTDCPYIVNLCKTKGTIYDNFWSKGHPSQPNYMRNFFNVSIFSDNTIYAPNTRSESNLYTALKAKGKAWENYIDALPSVGYVGSYSGTYAPKHDAGRYANNIDQSVRKPLTLLPNDLNALSDGVYFISPDMNNSGHDKNAAYADNWTKTNAQMQRIIAYVQNPVNHAILCFSWDEGSATNQTFLGIIGGDEVKKGARVNIGFDTYDFVNMKTDLFGAARINMGIGRTGIMNQWVAGATDTVIIPPIDTVRPPVTGTNKTAFRRAANLKDGMNYPAYLEGSTVDLTKLSEVKVQIQMMNVLQFEYVRLPCSFIDTAKTFIAIDSIYKLVKGLGMKMIIDMHGVDFSDANYTAKSIQLINLWKAIGKRLQYTDPECMYLELHNEPYAVSAANWKTYINKLVTALRPVISNHTFIVGAVDHNSLYRFNDMGVVNDTNVIYNFHFYEPLLFTHQGASWCSDCGTTGMPYPYIASRMPVRPTGMSPFKDFLWTQYPEAASYNFLYARTKIGVDWGVNNKVPVICTEAGAYKKYAVPTDRCNYYRDIKKISVSLALSLGIWEWKDDFSFFNGVPSLTNVDPCIISALGIILPTGNVCWRTDTIWKDESFTVAGCSVCSRRVIDKIIQVQIPCPSPLQPPGVAAKFAKNPNAVPDNNPTKEKLEAIRKAIVDNNKRK